MNKISVLTFAFTLISLLKVGAVHAASIVFKNNNSTTVKVAYAMKYCWNPNDNSISGGCNALVKSFYTVSPGESKTIYSGDQPIQQFWLHIHSADWSYEHKPSDRLSFSTGSCVWLDIPSQPKQWGNCRLSPDNNSFGRAIRADKNFTDGVLNHGNTYTFFKTNLSGNGGTFTYN